MRRAIASLRRMSSIPPSRSSRPLRMRKVRSPRSTRTTRMRPESGGRTEARAAAARPPCAGPSRSPMPKSVVRETQIRGSGLRWTFRTLLSTRPRAETTKPSAPRRRSRTGRSAWTRTRSVCGKSRSKLTETTLARLAIRRSISSPLTSSRLRPLSPASAARTSACVAAGPPTTTSRCTAKSEVSRATRKLPTPSASSANPTSSDLPDGARRRSDGAAGRTGRAAARAIACLRAGATLPDSPLCRRPLQGGQLERPEELDLVLELDAETLVDARSGLGHQRQRVGRGRAACVLDEVGVPLGDHGAAPPNPFQAALLDRPTGAELRSRVLEHAAERALVRGLRVLALREQRRHLRADRDRVPRLELQPDLCHDVAGAQVRRPVTEREVAGRPDAHRSCRDDDRLDEHRAEVPSVGAGVHPHAPAHRAWDGGCELEPAQTGVACPMEADGVRRSATGHELLAFDVHLGERAGESEDERVDTVVVPEHVRSEPDRLDRRALATRPGE